MLRNIHFAIVSSLDILVALERLGCDQQSFMTAFRLRSCWDRSTPSPLTGGRSEFCCMKCWLVSHPSTETMKMSYLSPSAWILPITLAGSTRRPRTWSSGSVSFVTHPAQSIIFLLKMFECSKLPQWILSDFLQFFERDPTRRLGVVGDIRLHPFFKMIDWPALERREVEPPFKPKVVCPVPLTEDALLTHVGKFWNCHFWLIWLLFNYRKHQTTVATLIGSSSVRSRVSPTVRRTL